MRLLKLNLIIIILIAAGFHLLLAQVVYLHPTASSVYDFLDELAGMGFVDIQSGVKPYTGKQIEKYLVEAYSHKSEMTERMQKELVLYLSYFSDISIKSGFKDKVLRLNENPNTKWGLSIYGLDFFYCDSLINLRARPILGYQTFSASGINLSQRWNGIEATSIINTNVGVYASLRDNHESGILTSPSFFNQRYGVPVKDFGNKGYDYSESRGGIVYFWKWGSLGLVKEHFIWGEGYHGSNIFSGRVPSFASIVLKIEPAPWIAFNYFHGWLVSNVVDSARSYYDDFVYRPVYHNKFIAANLFTIMPLKGLQFSFGNSIIYSDLGVHPAYLNPFMFYKSVDHTLNNTNQHGETGQNSQMFFMLSSRQIKKIHIYSNLFIDELNIGRIKSGKNHNYYSLKIGSRIYDFLIDNFSCIAEYTFSKPLTYAHKISTTTFTTNGYNLGHYLRDNSKELYIGLIYKPLRGLHLSTSYTKAWHYDDYIYDNRPQINDYPPFLNLTWSYEALTLEGRYNFFYNAGLMFEITLSNSKGYDANGQTAAYYLEKYTPEIYRGKKTIVSAGIFVGF